MPRSNFYVVLVIMLFVEVLRNDAKVAGSEDTRAGVPIMLIVHLGNKRITSTLIGSAPRQRLKH